MPEDYYKFQGGNVSNMYIKATNVIYLYQLYAGSNEGYEKETGDLTYIPPLNCFLPKFVGEIGTIDENPGVGATGRYVRKKKTKLNIFTQTGADVKVNGITPLPTEGPYVLTGNPDWVTYSIKNVTGNITVTSTKAVMTGIIGGDGTSGFGGFFAGVSSMPIITKKGGSCIPGIILETNSDLDSYQWQLNGIDIPGATTYTYTPTQSGNYTVLITRGSCSLVTAPIKVLNCVKETTENLQICQQLIIQPKFTISSQTVDPKSVLITREPERGRVAVNSITGIITYKPYPAVYGEDIFSYKFCGLSEFEDCEEITVHVDVRKLTVQDDTLLTCKANGIGIFNLTLANLNENLTVTKIYYRTLLGAQTEDSTQQILNFTSYPSAGEDVYVLVKTSDGCSEIAKITLSFLQAIDTSLYNSDNCDEDFDGIIRIKLSDITRAILPSSSGLVVRYYSTDSFAQAGLSNNLPEDYSYTVSNTIYIRIESQNCTPIILPLALRIGTTLPLLKSSVTVSNCSYDIDTNSTIDLQQYVQQFTSENNVNVKYYTSIDDARNNENEILNPVPVNLAETYYLRFSKNKYCPVIGSLILNLPKASKILTDKIICADAEAFLDAGPDFKSYLWSTGETTSNITVGVGDYYVDLTSENGCTYRQKITVTQSEAIVIKSIKISGSTVEIFASGGIEPYEYSVDGVNYQNSNIFKNVPKGNQTAYVRSSDNCGSAEKTFTIYTFNNVITPNDDGINDIFDLSILQDKTDVSVQIYDRYGVLVFRNTSSTYSWNGKKEGRKLPTASYWVILKWTDPDSQVSTIYTNWILLKNR